jgi:hypothetical protein
LSSLAERVEKIVAAVRPQPRRDVFHKQMACAYEDERVWMAQLAQPLETALSIIQHVAQFGVRFLSQVCSDERGGFASQAIQGGRQWVRHLSSFASQG